VLRLLVALLLGRILVDLVAIFPRMLGLLIAVELLIVYMFASWLLILLGLFTLFDEEEVLSSWQPVSSLILNYVALAY